MTKVTVRTFGHLTTILGGNQMGFEFSGSTVGDLLDALMEKFGGPLRGVLFPQGTFSDLMVVLVNGQNIGHLDELMTTLKDGDVVSVLPVTAGG